MIFTIHVIPRSSRNELVEQPDGSYKARLTAAPVDGAANQMLVELVSKEWDVPKSRIRITRGFTSRKKMVEIQ